MGRLINPGDWDAAVSETQHSVCSNYYGAAFSIVSVDCFSSPYPDTDTVCQVFVAYMNLAHDRKIPEYAPGAHPVTGAGSPYWPAYDGAVAVDRVATVTNIDTKLIDEILFELYWATRTGRITNVRFIAPWSFRLNEATLTTVPEGTDLEKNRGWDFSITDVIRWGLILGVVGVGAYAVTGLVTTVHGVSTALKHE
ncbi:MAG TPA: hypothetical protein VHI13_11690 [Candidatus Kapabacteria bacterium]|nr:hypothetical protein [Candidatus Kapabacteria bacterium]